MESSLHRTLKLHYSEGDPTRSEISVDGYRIDAIDRSGRLIEVQAAALSALRGKLSKLLPEHPVRVVKPLFFSRRLIKRSKPNGPDLSQRWSPKRGTWLDVFDEWIGLARLFPHPNLQVEVVALSIAEIRCEKKRRKRKWNHEHVFDRLILEVGGSLILEQPDDLWSLFDHPPATGEVFTTRELADRIGRPLAFAQRVAYCLRYAGAVDDLGKASRFRLYARSTQSAPVLTPEAAYDSAGKVPA